jgi:O-antigen/teichoic acid export membrane protein
MRKAYAGAVLASLQPLVLGAMMLPATMYVVRELGAVGYGQWTAATALVAVTMFVTNLGLRMTFVRTVARNPQAAGQALADQLGARLCLSVMAASVSILVCLFVGYSQTILLCTAISAVGLMLTTVSTTAGDLLQGLQRLGVVAAANLAAGFLLTLTSVVVVAYGQGPVGVSLSYLVGPLVSLAIMLWVIRRQHYPVRVALDSRRLRRLLWEARFMGPAQLVHSASLNAEALLLPRLVGEAQFGHFSGGTLLVTRLMAVPDGLGTALYPAVVEADRIGPQAVARLVTRFVVLSLASGLAMAIGVYVLAGPITGILFPHGTQTTLQVIQITIWLLPVMSVLFVLGGALNGLNGDAAQARAVVISSIINLGVTVLLVWKYGVVGAAWSMVLRYVIWLGIFVPCSMATFRPVLRAARPARPRVDGPTPPIIGAPGEPPQV